MLQKYITWPIRCAQQRSRDATGGGCGASSRINDDRPFISYTRTQDGPSLITEVRVIRAMFKGHEEGILCGEEIGTEWESEAESDMDLENDPDDDESRSGSDTEVDEPDFQHIRHSARRSRSRRHNEGPPDGFDDGDDSDDADDDDNTPRAVYTNTQLMTPPPEYFTYPAREPASKDLRVPQSRPATETYRRHKKAHSVPLSPSLDPGNDPSGASDPDRRRPAKRRSTVNLRGHRPLGFVPATDKPRRSGERRAGRKRCIQLDMGGHGEDEGIMPASRAGEDGVGHGAYHLGMYKDWHSYKANGWRTLADTVPLRQVWSGHPFLISIATGRHPDAVSLDVPHCEYTR